MRVGEHALLTSDDKQSMTRNACEMCVCVCVCAAEWPWQRASLCLLGCFGIADTDLRAFENARMTGHT